MLCDPRLVARPYGRRILRSLPPMKLTRRLADVEDFFRDYIADERVKLA
jgi:ATP-dependent DNA helicase DinG